MGNQYGKKINWTIKNFSSLQSEQINSDHFVVGGCKWRLRVYPKGERYIDYLSLYLDVDDSETLPSGWRRHTKFRLTLVNQFREYSSIVHEVQMWFDHKTPNSGSREMILLTKLLNKNGGFLVNGDVKIVAEVDVLEVTGKSDVLEEISFVRESTDVNGLQVLPPQLVESVTVSSLFKDYPDIESKFCPTNPHLRTSCMNILVSLTDILCQSHEKLSIGDLADAYSALRYVTKAGFKLNWLEEKLKEAGKPRLQEIEDDLKGLKQKCAEMEALVEFLQ